MVNEGSKIEIKFASVLKAIKQNFYLFLIIFILFYFFKNKIFRIIYSRKKYTSYIGQHIEIYILYTHTHTQTHMHT